MAGGDAINRRRRNLYKERRQSKAAFKRTALKRVSNPTEKVVLIETETPHVFKDNTKVISKDIIGIELERIGKNGSLKHARSISRKRVSRILRRNLKSSTDIEMQDDINDEVEEEKTTEMDLVSSGSGTVLGGFFKL